MRIALYAFSALLLVGAAGLGQDAKKKDAKPGDADKKKPAEVKEVAGKSLEQWLVEVHSIDPSKRENAMRSVLGFGPEKAQKAVPAILAELKKHNKPGPIDLTVRLSGIAALGTILSAVEKPSATQVKDAVTILRTFSKDDQVLVRARAAEALGRLAGASPDVQDAIDDVMRVAGDPQTWQARQAGIEALAALAIVRASIDKKSPPPRVVATFEKALKDNSMQVRIAAVKALAQLNHLDFGDDVRRARALESVLAKDAEPSVRIWCDLALMTVKKKIDTEHLVGVIKMLHFKSDPAVRIQAAQSLGMIAQQAPPGLADPKNRARALNGKDRVLVVNELKGGLDDPDINVVSACIGALFQAEPDEAITPIAQLLNHPQATRRAQAAQALSLLGEKAKPAETLLIQKLFDTNLDVVVQAINALVQMDSVNSVAALEKLAAAPPQDNEIIKKAATDAIRIIMEEKAKTDKKGKAPAKGAN